MRRLILLIALVFLPGYTWREPNVITIKLKSKQVCSKNINKCFPIAIGSNAYPSPTNKGPYIITNLRKNGFDWKNPFTGKVYKAGTHNLGHIWIGITSNKLGDVGIHITPDKTKPLSQQWSHGCFRGDIDDVIELADSVNYFDIAYIEKDL